MIQSNTVFCFVIDNSEWSERTEAVYIMYNINTGTVIQLFINDETGMKEIAIAEVTPVAVIGSVQYWVKRSLSCADKVYPMTAEQFLLATQSDIHPT